MLMLDLELDIKLFTVGWDASIIFLMKGTFDGISCNLGLWFYAFLFMRLEFHFI